MSGSRAIFLIAAATAGTLAAGAAAQDYQYQYDVYPPQTASTAQTGPATPSSGWFLTLGASGMLAPKFKGARSDVFKIAPIVSLGRYGNQARFVSRNDNISLGFIDTKNFRFGATGKFIWRRDAGTATEIAGLSPIPFGGELGGFAEVYPTEWVRIRGEVRHGIRSHDGVVGEVAADAFFDVHPKVRISGGPRVSMATARYYDAYYGVTAAESAASGLAPYAPEGGFGSLGVGGAVTWNVTPRLTASAFGEFKRLVGPAARSSLVRQRGSVNQALIGLSTTYRFDLTD